MRRGELYLYAVLCQEQATLAIYKNGMTWEIDELKGWCNQDVSEVTLAMVLDWLRKNQKDNLAPAPKGGQSVAGSRFDAVG